MTWTFLTGPTRSGGKEKDRSWTVNGSIGWTVHGRRWRTDTWKSHDGPCVPPKSRPPIKSQDGRFSGGSFAPWGQEFRRSPDDVATPSFPGRASTDVLDGYEIEDATCMDRSNDERSPCGRPSRTGCVPPIRPECERSGCCRGRATPCTNSHTRDVDGDARTFPSYQTEFILS